MKKNSVYIVEDSFIISLHLRKILEQEGYEVVGISDNGKQAITEVLSLKPELLLMDVMLNGDLDGVETVSRIKEAMDIQVIYITALTNKETLQRIKFTDPNSYLKKPFDDSEVLTIVELTLQKSKKNVESWLQQEGLSIAINNLSLMVFSIDRELRIQAANKAFVDYVNRNYGLQVKVGQRLGQEKMEGDFMGLTQATWLMLLERVFAGEEVRDTIISRKRIFQLIINPLIRNGHVVGASYSIEDVTEQKSPGENLLTETKQQLGELKLMALRSALSEHFVFNTLNSIQYIIAKGDSGQAMKYLSHFSRLVRIILSQSMLPLVGVKTEIELVKNYLELELLRFEDKLDISLSIDPFVEQSNLLVPPLVIQPYIENAICRGLNQDQEKGRVKIDIAIDGHYVLITIKDNGIGYGTLGMSGSAHSKFEGKDRMLDSSERLPHRHLTDLVHVDFQDMRNVKGEQEGTHVAVRIQLETEAHANV